MKKITFFLMAAMMMATTGLAQTGQKRVVQLPGTTKGVVKEMKAQPRMADMQRQHRATPPLRNMLASRSQNSIPKAPWQRKMVNKEITGGKFISEQPAGEYVSYVRSGDAYAYTMFGPMYTTLAGGLGDVVFGADNKVYRHNRQLPRISPRQCQEPWREP